VICNGDIYVIFYDDTYSFEILMVQCNNSFTLKTIRNVLFHESSGK